MQGLTVSEVSGFGRQKEHTKIYRGAEYQVSFSAKLRIEIAVANNQGDLVLATIDAAARTGSIGDGKIWVVPTETLVRTGERNTEAL